MAISSTGNLIPVRTPANEFVASNRLVFCRSWKEPFATVTKRACGAGPALLPKPRPRAPAVGASPDFAVSEDGALHAEKFYRTVTEEFESSRPAFRSRYLVALARVTASAHGYAAPGYADACRLLAT